MYSLILEYINILVSWCVCWLMENPNAEQQTSGVYDEKVFNEK